MATKAELERELESMKIALKASSLEKNELLEKIQRLRQNVKEAKEETRKLKYEIEILKQDNERIVNEANIDGRYLTREIKRLKVEYEERLDSVTQRLEEKYQILINEHKESVRNERNAGRKTIINEELIEKINEYSTEGKTQKLISELLNISVGTVNKVIKNLNK